MSPVRRKNLKRPADSPATVRQTYNVMKTYSLKSKDISRSWYLIDASKIPLGRLATMAASRLIGKHKPTITSHIDNGDYVVVINAGSLVTTGVKGQKKIYYRHSGFPGGLYKRTLDEQMALNPIKVVAKAVEGMLPTNKLRQGRLKRLKIYEGAAHGHDQHNLKELSLVKDGGSSGRS